MKISVECDHKIIVINKSQNIQEMSRMMNEHGCQNWHHKRSKMPKVYIKYHRTAW